MENYVDYLYYLLPSPLKILGKKVSAWYILCRVLGGYCDRLKKTILDVREQSMILTCAPELLPVFGQERDMPRLTGESEEDYRVRLAMKCIIAQRAGTTRGILAAVRSLGYEHGRVEPLYLTEPDRWAEATVWIDSDKLVIPNRDILLQAVNEVKPASALLFLEHERITSVPLFFGAVLRIGSVIDLRQFDE